MSFGNIRVLRVLKDPKDLNPKLLLQRPAHYVLARFLNYGGLWLCRSTVPVCILNYNCTQ